MKSKQVFMHYKYEGYDLYMEFVEVKLAFNLKKIVMIVDIRKDEKFQKRLSYDPIKGKLLFDIDSILKDARKQVRELS